MKSLAPLNKMVQALCLVKPLKLFHKKLSYFDEEVVPISDGLFVDFSGLSEPCGVEEFLTVTLGHGGDNGGTASLGDSSEVALVDSSEGEDVVFDEVFGGKIVDTLGGDDNGGAGLDNLLNSVLEDVHFPGEFKKGPETYFCLIFSRFLGSLTWM
jgi:hypothetical protein